MTYHPKISIITPSFNQGKTLTQTIDSVLGQKYPNLEYIIMDGGSSDNSADIIRSHQKHLAYWVSEKDGGQSNAINSGYRKATGEIIAWLNSDDEYCPESLAHVADLFGDPAVDVVAGYCEVFGEGVAEGRLIRPSNEKIEYLPASTGIPQPSVFMRKSVIDRRGFWVRDDLNYAMDIELWCYMRSQNPNWKITDKILSRFYAGPQTKTSTGGNKIFAERAGIYAEYSTSFIPLVYFYRWITVPLIKLERTIRPCRLRPAVVKMIGAVQWMLTKFYGQKPVEMLNWKHLV